MRTPFPVSDPVLAGRLSRPGYPRSNCYDPWWVVENRMGPHPLWLAESLSVLLPFEAGWRVLDLGCGKALTSIFMAHEFGVRVTAADLWVPARDNQARIVAAGVEGFVEAAYAEAHALPFEPESFDAIVSFDAYHYFGTDDLYLNYLLRFLRPGGALGIVVPGLISDFTEVPEQLRTGWDPAFWSFHSPQWWRRHWEHSEAVDVLHADTVPDGWRLWLEWTRMCLDLNLPPLFPGSDGGAAEVGMLEADGGANLGFTRVLARRR